MSTIDNLISSVKEIDYADLSSWPFWLKIVAALLIGVGIIGGTYAYLYTSKIKAIQVGEAKEARLKKEFLEKRKQSISLPLYEQQMVEIKQRFAVLLQQLPNKTEIPALLTDISEAGVENGLEFKRFRPKEERKQDFFVTVPIQIKASGSYHQLASFVSDIANFQRIVTLGDFKLTRDSGNDKASLDQPPLIFDADVITYHYQQSALDEPSADGDKKKQRIQK